MRCADVMELLGHDVLREFGLVAFAAQVRKIKMLQVGGHDLRGGFGGGGVGKMAVASEDALFQRPRPARTFLQHFHVVIGFEDEHVRGANAFEHELGNVAEVGDKADIAARRPQKISDGVLRVVRNGKSLDENVGDFKTCAGGKKLPVDFGFEGAGGFKGEIGLLAPFVFEGPDGPVLRAAVAINRNLKFVGDAQQPGNVVAVFVRDQNGGEIFRRATDAREALADLARGKSGVHEDARLGGLDIGAIAGRAAGENGEFDRHGWKLMSRRRAGNFFRTRI